MRQPQYALRIGGFLGGRNDERIGDQVVDELGAHGTGIAYPAYLDRAQAARQQRAARAHGVALQIDKNIEVVRINAGRSNVIGVMRDIDEMLAGGAQACAHWTIVVRAVGIGEDLEPAAVVQLQHFGEQVGRRVFVKIGGEVTNPQPRMVTRGGGAGVMPGRDRAKLRRRPAARVRELLCGGGRLAQQ